MTNKKRFLVKIKSSKIVTTEKMPRIFNILLILAISGSVFGQVKFSDADRLAGYALIEGRSYFVFDENVYNVQPEMVVVEGGFRNWKHDMTDKTWWLEKADDNLWVLEIPFEIAVHSPFKFRINEGDWLEPPADAPNLKGGNLIFAHNITTKMFRAELVSARHIRIKYQGFSGNPNLEARKYQLTDANGVALAIEDVFYIQPGELQIYPVEPLDPKRIYYLTDLINQVKCTVRSDGWFRHIYTSQKLGAFFDERSGKTYFRLFAPRATMVNLYLYTQPGAQAFTVASLSLGNNGIWEASYDRNLNGIYYDYTVHGYSEPGSHYYESNPVHITDPYGQVSVDSWGPCRVWPEVAPPRSLRKGRPPMEDVVAYEVHVQDFTRFLPVDENKRGTFAAFIEAGLRNSVGEKIGFDHLTDLGINVIHLMPVQEFLHYQDNLWSDTFIHDPYMIEQGINHENYQWGYRTSHALAIESRYRVKGSEWGAQNSQFRDLVDAFHAADIAVIVDVVFNHTAERMDGRMDYLNFSVLDKQYYYRTDENLDFIGEYGTETKSEERPMVQRWIIDQCKNLVDQYGIDGFRIDLAGQTDEQTLRKLKQVLGPDIIIYGEPWIASADPNYEDNPDWDWYKEDSPITFFQDDSRNAFKGPPSNPVNKWKDRGYAGGNGDRESVKNALNAGFDTDVTPVSGINYLDIHDNWALADRFAIDDWDGRKGVHENRIKIAATLLLTSLGPVVMHGGTEILRSKGLAPLVEIKKKFQEGYIYFHGKRDTYNLATANAFLWENKGKNLGDDAGMVKCNYDNLYKFWRGLIRLRNSDMGKIFRISNKPKPGYFRWIEPDNTRLLGYIVNEQMMVLINSDTTAGVFAEFTLSPGGWKLIGTIDQVDHINGITEDADAFLAGNSNHSITLDAESIKIWYREN